MFQNLDKRDSLILKALAISAIVFHNYFHWVGPVRQDEFTFGAERFWVFVKHCTGPVPAFEGFFAFFGHFGVDVFIFLSAYGLARSHWNDRDSWVRFMWERIKKLYPVFGLIVLTWLFLAAVQLGTIQALHLYGLKLLWMLAGISNLIPGNGLPPVGPWWFIPFIVQFYALWPLLKRITERFGQRGLLILAALCICLILVANQWLNHWSMSLLATPIGRMPDLCLGIIAARFPVRPHWPIIFTACAALLLGSIYRPIWPLTYVSALILSLAAYRWARPVLRNSWLLERIGKYSLVIFLVNGIVRLQFLKFATSPGAELLFGCISALTSLVVAAIIQEALLPRAISRKFKVPAIQASNERDDAPLLLQEE